MIAIKNTKGYGAIMATFKERFIYLKIEKGVNYEQIANAVHTNRTSLSKFVKGDLALKKEMIEALADYFDVDQAYLLGESNVRRADNYQMIPNKVKWLQDQYKETTINLLNDLDTYHLTPDQARQILKIWVETMSKAYDDQFGKEKKE